MKPVLILLADASRARLLRALNRHHPPEELRQWVHPESRMHASELGYDESQPRTHDRMGHHRHKIEPHQAPTRQEADQFARQLGEALDAALRDDSEARLVLFAPPRFLGQLREHLGDHAAAAVVHEKDSELTLLEPREVLEHLPEKVWHQL